jgi:hypothetical protein
MTILSGVSNTSGLNGHYGRYLDWTIPFLDKNSHAFEFRDIPHVVATADRGSAEDEVSWAVTILSVSKRDFVVRIRSVDMTREENPGWNGTVRVQWIAHLNE